MPPASSRPTIESNSIAIAANASRNTVAAMIPTRIALLLCAGGKPAAARPITTALSPASTRSIMITCRTAVIAPCENMDRSIIHFAPGPGRADEFDDRFNLAQNRRRATHQGEGAGHVPGGARIGRSGAKRKDGEESRAGRRNERPQAEYR